MRIANILLQAVPRSIGHAIQCSVAKHLVQQVNMHPPHHRTILTWSGCQPDPSGDAFHAPPLASSTGGGSLLITRLPVIWEGDYPSPNALSVKIPLSVYEGRFCSQGLPRPLPPPFMNHDMSTPHYIYEITRN